MLHNICFPYFIMMNEVLKKPCEDLFSFLRVVGTAQRRNISVCEPEETVRKKKKMPRPGLHIYKCLSFRQHSGLFQLWICKLNLHVCLTGYYLGQAHFSLTCIMEDLTPSYQVISNFDQLLK